MPGTIRVERTYPHAPARVWRALTDPEQLARWLMPNDFEPRVGHRFTFTTEPGPGFDGIVRCEVLELTEERTLSLSWRGGPLDTVVTFTLEPVGEGSTRLRVEHTGFRGLKARLVGRILALGNRTIYGRRLPRVLDDLASGSGAGPEGVSAPEDGEACMQKEQGVLVGLLRVLTGKRTAPQSREEDRG